MGSSTDMAKWRSRGPFGQMRRDLRARVFMFRATPGVLRTDRALDIFHCELAVPEPCIHLSEVCRDRSIIGAVPLNFAQVRREPVRTWRSRGRHHPTIVQDRKELDDKSARKPVMNRPDPASFVTTQ